jgi:DNA-binding MarR family transcriptional regulator
MDFLLAALGHPARIAIVEYLLGLDAPSPSAREATHAELRRHLDFQRGTLTKSLAKLKEADLLVESPGPRADQPVYRLRQQNRVLRLLESAAELDAALSDELATLHRLDANLKTERANRFAAATRFHRLESE